METAQLPWTAHSFACLCSFRKRFSLYHISIYLVLISVHCLSYSHHAQPLCHYYNLPIGTRKPLLGALEVIPSHQALIPFSSQGGSAPDPDWGWTGGPPMNSFHCINILLVMGRPKIGNTIPGMV